MSVLEKYFAIFEGESDAGFRQRAQTALKAIQAALKRGAKPDVFTGPAPVASFDLGQLLKDPDMKTSRLEFVPGQKSREAAFVPETQTLRFFVDTRKLFQVDPSELNPESWKTLVTKYGSDILGRMEQAFIHEFIHYMDWKRIHPDDEKKRSKVFSSVPSSKTGGDAAYFNNPLELNAHIQASLSKIETYLASQPPEKVKKILGGSADSFYKNVTAAMPKRMLKSLDDKSINKLKKRIAQAYQDITKKQQGEKG